MIDEIREEYIQPPDKITSILTFMDGTDAHLVSTHPDYETGKRKFIFYPGDMLKYIQQIQESEYDSETGKITKEYDDTDCLDTSTSKKNIRWFVFSDYRGHPTKAKEYMNQRLLLQVRVLRKRIDDLQMSLRILQRESFKRESFPAEQNFKILERFEEIKKIAYPGS